MSCYKTEQVRSLRARLGLSQRTFAEKLQVGPASIHRWEQGITTPSPMAQRHLHALENSLPPKKPKRPSPNTPALTTVTTLASGESVCVQCRESKPHWAMGYCYRCNHERCFACKETHDSECKGPGRGRGEGRKQEANT